MFELIAPFALYAIPVLVLLAAMFGERAMFTATALALAVFVLGTAGRAAGWHDAEWLVASGLHVGLLFVAILAARPVALYVDRPATRRR